MAEYFPLLDRAISGLTEPTAEARRSVYERARSALVGQLRRMEPPVPEEDIARENAALDEAIARVELKFRDDAASAAGGTDAPPRGERTAQARPGSSAPPAASSARVPLPPVPAIAPPVVPPPSRDRPVMGARPAPPVAPVAAAPQRPVGVAARVGASPPRGTRPVMALRPAASAPEGNAAAGPPPAASPAEPGFAEALDAAGRADRDGPPPAAVASSGPKGRDSGLRPPAPRPRAARAWSRPAVAAVCLAGALVVLGIGTTAYRLRDRPEQVVATRAAGPDAAGADAATPGKTAERAAPSGTDAAPDANAEPGKGIAVPAPVPQGLDTGAAPAIAVAQRAALLVDAPDDPQRVKTYVGTVVWHLDSVSPGGGQALASAVKADIDIPEADLKVTMLMQKNPEPQLPASHTIEFHFLPQPGDVLGPIKQINVPEMRKDDEAPTGDPLSGVPVAITDNYFLVGLSRGAAETQNVRLMADRNWFDMSVLFTSGKLGKLTFEKGTAGQRAIEDALKAWK